MQHLSNRINNLTESQTIAMAQRSRELQSQGVDVINLSLGEPDFNTPDFIKEAAKKAIDDNYSHYMPVPGYLDLREAICEKFKRDNGLDYSPGQIVVSTGAKQCLANALLCLLNKGDEAIIPSPYWVTYKEIIKLADATPIIIPTTVEADFKITPDQLRQHITEKSKIFLFSSPCNPTGTVYTKEELKSLAEVLAEKEDLYVVSDEIYEYINFVGKHQSISQFDFIQDRVVMVNGVSKAFAMTGWRVGYLGAPLWLAQACSKLQGQFTSGTCGIAQKAAREAVQADPETTTGMCNAFKKRRDLVLQLLGNISGMKLNVPDGAFYVFPDISSYFGKSYEGGKVENATDLSMYLLNNAHVAMVTGDAFGDPNCIRFSYAASEDAITGAVSRIKEALSKLN